MNPLGYCLSAVPVIAGCGYGIYALTRGGQSINASSEVSVHSQNPVSEQITQNRETLEASGSSISESARQETESVTRQQNLKTKSTRKSPSSLKWVLGKEGGGEKRLLVQIKEGSNLERARKIEFGSGFTVFADEQELDTGYILCTINSQDNKYFLMKREGSTTRYTTLNGDSVPACNWINEPQENVTKYSISKWDESSQQSKPLKDVKQIDLSTCTIEGNNRDRGKRKLKMHCRGSSNLMSGGRPSANIFIELKKVTDKRQ